MSETENKVVPMTAMDRQNLPAPSLPLPATEISAGLLSKIIEETSRQVEARVSRPSPFGITTFQELENFAERVCRTGLCPKDYKGKVDDAIVAVMKGAEIGLPPMASLESICVVNGRPSVWGEAVPGLCMRTGLVADVRETFEGEGAALTAVCVVIRRGRPSPHEGRFSISDAAHAKLGNVHTAYPRDMIMWRARHRAWHAAFPDVLRGLATAEIEQEEAALPAWQMPKPEKSWYTARPKSKDGWDDSWFDGVASALFGEQNAWEWMNLLVGKLKEAPTLRDVDELASLAVVVKTTEAAPDQAKGVIAEAFTEARKRLAPPESKPVETAKTDAPAKAAEKPAETAKAEPAQTVEEKQPAQQAAAKGEAPVEFEAFLLDEWGEPIGDDSFTDPVLFATALGEHWAKSTNQEALMEHNADGVEDAKATGPAAGDIIAGLGRPEEQGEPDPVVVEAPKAGTRDSWKGWLMLFREEAARLTAGGYLPFIAANTDVIKLAPGSVRPLAIKALIEQAGALEIKAPNLAEMLKPPAKVAETAKEVAPPPAEEAKAETADAPDPDRVEMARWVRGLKDAKTPDEVDTLGRNPALGNVAARWRSEGKTALIAELQKAFNDHKAELKAPGT